MSRYRPPRRSRQEQIDVALRREAADRSKWGNAQTGQAIGTVLVLALLAPRGNT